MHFIQRNHTGLLSALKRQFQSAPRTPRSVFFASVVFTSLLAVMSISACASGAEGADSPGDTPGAGTPTPTVAAPTNTPTPTATWPGMALELHEGDFWSFRWEWTDQSCAQGSGCSSDDEDGVFNVTLGSPRTMGGVDMFQVVVSGDHTADGGIIDLAPGWSHIGIDGLKLVASMGSETVTIFDAQTGEWTGGGFFSRFSDSETHVASATSIDSTHAFGDWNGFQTGSAIAVVRSDSETLCEIIEGRRICPRDQAFSLTESQLYRDGVGPLGYTYTFSASFSGGGFSSSTSSRESVALVASSLRGDSSAPQIFTTPSPTPLSDALELVFGPANGAMVLDSSSSEIPDFATGVNLAEGIVEVTFLNPDVGGDNWSYGITFRQSDEETFHAVYVSGNGQWKHFVRNGSLASEVSLGGGGVTLNTGVGQQNRLKVVFGSDNGQLYVNDALIADLNIPPSMAASSGDVRVMTGIQLRDVLNDAETVYEGLTVHGR